MPDDDTVQPDGTLRLTDEGIQMPDFLKGHVGSFTIRTADVTGELQTTEHGLPETDFYDGVIAIYPDDDGEYNPDLGPGLMAIETPQHGEDVFEIIDERTHPEQEGDPDA